MPLGTICPNLSSAVIVVALVHNSCTVLNCHRSSFVHAKNVNFPVQAIRIDIELTTKENCPGLKVAANFFHFYFSKTLRIRLKTLRHYTLNGPLTSISSNCSNNVCFFFCLFFLSLSCLETTGWRSLYSCKKSERHETQELPCRSHSGRPWVPS